jgi:DNA-binding NtrC family response regulator
MYEFDTIKVFEKIQGKGLMAYKALVIDDDVSLLELLRIQLGEKGFEVLTADRGKTGIELILENDLNIILTDLNLPDINGIEMVKKAKEISPDTEIIMITGQGSMEKAIEATKAGAFHYVEKPIEFEKLLLLIEKALEREQQAAEIRELRGKLSKTASFAGIVGGSKSMQDIYELIESVAASDANILILGESGTGKEIIANAIHFKSQRAKKSFIKVNCSALPKDLIESELFGHIKGAFTGATADKVGHIGRANGGSLLLDEIAEMPVELQPKLLRVLQDKVYNRVGSDRPQEVDFRLISATNRDPFESIRLDALREDLYYRINTIEIRIPPLRERMDDVPMLAEHFLKIYAEKYKRGIQGFSQYAYDQMLNSSWRGNVRELEHVIERAVLLSKGDSIEVLNLPAEEGSAFSATTAGVTVSPETAVRSAAAAAGESAIKETGAFKAPEPFSGEDLFEEIGKVIVEKLPEPQENETNRDVFDAIECGVVMAALKRTGGNKQAAANLLGLYRPRLYGMIKRHSLEKKN